MIRYMKTFDVEWKHFRVHIACALAEEALAFEPNHKEILGAEDVKNFRNDFLRSMPIPFVFPKDYLPFFSSDSLRHAVSEVLKQWEAKMDEQLCGGMKGSFSSQCRIYGLSSKELLYVALDVIKDEDDGKCYKMLLHLDAQLNVAVGAVTFGHLGIKKSCW